VSVEYDENYFKQLNYVDYLSRRSRYFSLSRELTGLLSNLGLVSVSSRIMDYGCALGFLMEGLEHLGYRNVCGYDISSWAREQAKRNDLNVYGEVSKLDFDIIFCLDVLEHMTESQIDEMFSFYNANVLVARIPCSTNDGKSFHLDVSNTDKTHINCMEKPDWINLLSRYGYNVFLPLHLYTIYDSPGVMCFVALKGDGIKYESTY
jgi:SAM-dependent methyltransferase